MNEPRPRRRRRRKKGKGSQAAQGQAFTPREKASDLLQGEQQTGGGLRRRGRRRRRGEGREPGIVSYASSEDLVRQFAGARPRRLTGVAGEERLEDIIRDLQSTFGVPQYPQEFRITIKVADEKANGNGGNPSPQPTPSQGGRRREKAPRLSAIAPAMEPEVGPSGENDSGEQVVAPEDGEGREGGRREAAPVRGRGRRRRRRKGGRGLREGNG